MSRLAAYSCFFCVIWALGAEGGAWPRKAGEGFASATVRLGWPQNLLERARAGESISLEPTSDYRTLYGEYGVTDRLTIGLDVGHSVSGAGKTVVFVSYPLAITGDSPHRLSLALGAGRIESEPVIRPGVSYGYGYSGKRLSGWVAVDALAEHFLGSQRNDYKLDVTFGLNLEGGKRAILQLQAGRQQGDDPFARLAPSYVVPWGDTRNVEVGLTVSLAGEADVGVLLGLWQAF